MTIEIFELDLIARATATSRTTRVGVEQELIVRDVRTGNTVAPDRLRGILADNAYLEHVSFEPGGQLELSLPPAASAVDAAGGRLSSSCPPGSKETCSRYWLSARVLRRRSGATVPPVRTSRTMSSCSTPTWAVCEVEVLRQR